MRVSIPEQEDLLKFHVFCFPFDVRDDFFRVLSSSSSIRSVSMRYI